MLVERSGLASRTVRTTQPPKVSAHIDALSNEMRAWGYPWNPARATGLASDARTSRFSFAGISAAFDKLDWRGRGAVPLWTYQLHYLEALEALAWEPSGSSASDAARDIAALMHTWDERARDGVGWDAYPTSIRSAHWCTALLLQRDALTAEEESFAFASLNTQLAHLARRLEWHLLGNHLLANLAALSRSALLFAPESTPWLGRVRALYQRQLTEQFSGDGLHQERTPLYHAMALRAALEEALLRRASGGVVDAEETQRLSRMLRADALMRRPDGSIRPLNDSAQAECPSRAYLERLGTRMFGPMPAAESGAFWLRDGAYAGSSDGDASCIVDAGAPAPPWQPGHAHCGALSFELEIRGRPVVVDSGVRGYDGDPLREYVRSTRAHNTVSIGGREQGEVWGTFRMARRWIVRTAESVAVEKNAFAFRAAISPFWSAGVQHEREFRLLPGSFTARDVITGAEGEFAESFVHLHPDLTATVDGAVVSVRANGAEVARIECTGFARVTLARSAEHPVQGWYCPDFGVQLPATAIVARVDRLGAEHRCGFSISWT